MRIVVDVMGGDHGCEVVIEGVKQALQANLSITECFLVGDQQQVQTALARTQLRDGRVTVLHASQVLTMEDKPVDGLRRKKDCSTLRAVE